MNQKLVNYFTGKLSELDIK